jgi:pyroglutamyl-peptidase
MAYHDRNVRTLLVAGFGPFPGAPHNPTAALVERLARIAQPSLRVISHVFPTQYAAVDNDLPLLLARHKPDALLMFGLHRRARTLRIETLARNAIGSHRDAGGSIPSRHAIAPGAAHQSMRAPAARLARAVRKAGVPAVLSRDAGSYLCNYLCWRATEAARRGHLSAAFVHVPPVARKTLRRGSRSLTAARLERAARAMLAELACCLGSAGIRP